MYGETHIAAMIAAQNPKMSAKDVVEKSFCIWNELEMQMDKRRQKEKEACNTFYKSKKTDKILLGLREELREVNRCIDVEYKKPEVERTKMDKLVDKRRQLDDKVSARIDTIQARIAKKYSIPTHTLHG